MTLGRGAVVPDGYRKEMEHQVRVGDALVAAHEATGFEVVRRPRATAEQQPAQTYRGPVAPLQRRRNRYGQLGRILDVDLEMVLEVLADRGQVLHHRNPQRS